MLIAADVVAIGHDATCAGFVCCVFVFASCVHHDLSWVRAAMDGGGHVANM